MRANNKLNAHIMMAGPRFEPNLEASALSAAPLLLPKKCFTTEAVKSIYKLDLIP